MKKGSQRKVLFVGLVLLLLLSCSISIIAASESNWSKMKGQTINVLAPNLTFVEGLKGLTPQFEEMTGVKVNIDVFNEPTTRRKAQIELASGSDAYDLIWVPGEFAISYINAGWLSPIDPLIKSKYTDNTYLDINDFIPSTLELMKSGRKSYGLPWFPATIIMYYRTDILKQAGIHKAPETIDELVRAVKKVHGKNGVAGIAMRGVPKMNLWIFSSFLHATGGGYFKDFKNGNMEPALNTTQSIEAARIYADLLKNYSIPGIATADYDQVVIAMQQGNVAFAIDGAPLAGRIVDPTKSKVIDKIGYAVVPGGTHGVHPAFAGHSWAIPKYAKNKNAAWAFMQWSTSKQIQKEVALKSNHVAVTRKSVWDDNEFRAKWNLKGEGDFLKTFSKSISLGDPDYRPRLTEWPLIEDIVGRALNEITVGVKTPEQAFEEANKRVRKLMVDKGYLKK